MIKLKWLFTCILLLSFAFAQETMLDFNERVTDLETGGKMAGVKVTLYQDGKVFKTVTTTTSGKYTIKAPVGHVYLIKFQKEGYVSKSVEVKFMSINEEDALKVMEVELPMELYKDHPDIDFSPIENAPIGKLEFDPNSGQMEFDAKYNKNQAKIQDKLLEQKKAAEEAGANEEKEKEEKFNLLVQEGDNAYSSKDYEAAVSKYQEALKIKDDTGLKAKLKMAQDNAAKAEAAAKKQADFDAKMKEGNDLLAQQKYQEAINKYKEAKTILPDKPEPDQKIADAQKILDEQAQQQAKFNEFLSQGKTALNAKNYDPAISNFEEALKINAGHPEATKLLAEAKAAKEKAENEAAAEAKKQEDYNKAMADADAKYNSEDYQGAIDKFKEAKGILPDKSEPQAGIDKAQAKLDEIAANQAAEAKKQEDYNKAMADAEAKFNAEDYQGAIDKFKEAKGILPDKSEPQAGIDKAQAKLDELAANEAAEAKKQEDYNKTMAEAEAKFNAEDFQGAIDKFKEAKGILPDKSEPQAGIDKAQAKLDELAANEAAEAKKQEDYNKAMADAEAKFNAEDFKGAIDKFKEAKGILPDKSEPQAGIDKAQAKLDELASNEAAEAKKQEDYNKAMADAEAKFNSEDYQGAIDKFTEAKNLYQDKQEPKDGIAKAQAKLDEIAGAEAAEKAKEERYTKAMAKAQEKYNSSDFEAALASYNDALAEYSDRQEAIDGKAKAQAKLDELAADQAAEAKKQEDYNKAMAEAEAKFNAEDYQGAIDKYNVAKGILPEKSEPQAGIDKAQAKLDELAGAEAAKKAKEDRYNKAMAEANSNFNAGEFQKAIDNYDKALAEFSDRQDPQDGIAKAQAKLDELAGAEAAKKAKEDRYNKAMAEANSNFNAGEFQKAIDNYNKALAEFSDRQEPKDGIAKAQGKLDELAGAEAAKQAKEDRYNKAMADANNNFSAGEYQKAIDNYNKALAEFSDRQDPKDGISKAQAKLDELAGAEAAKKAKEDRYNKAMADANGNFNTGEYQKAIDNYNKALSEFSDRQEPKDGITRAKAKLDEIAQQSNQENTKEQDYQAKIDEADAAFNSANWDEAKKKYGEAFAIIQKEYPQKQIDEINKRLNEELKNNNLAKQYQKFIDVADEKYNSRALEEAKGIYERASKMKKDDPYPKSQIAKIDEELKRLEAEKSSAELEAKYDAAIRDADAKFNSKSYDEAKLAYKKAYEIKATDYPQNQINKINDLLRAEMAEQLARQYQKIISVADEKFTAESYEEAIGLYERAMKINPSDPYPGQKIAEIKAILNPPNEKFYGDETDASTRDANVFIAKTEDNSWQRKVDTTQLKQEQREEALKNDMSDNLEARYENQAFGQKTQEQIEEQQAEGNSKHLENEEGVNDRLAYIEKLDKELIDDNEGNIYDNHVRADELEEKFAEAEKTNDEKRIENVDVAYEFQDQVDETLDESIDQNKETTYSNYEFTEKKKDEWSENDKERDGYRIENTDVAYEYQDQVDKTLDQNIDQNKETTYSNYEFTEKKKDEWSENDKERDGYRIENTDVAYEYQDQVDKTLDQNIDQNKETTYSNYEFTEKKKDEWSENDKERDGYRVENTDIAYNSQDMVDNYERSFDSKNDEQRFKNREYTQNVQDDIEESYKYNDEGRIDNIDSLKQKQDKLEKTQDANIDKNKENAYNNHDYAKDVEDKISENEKNNNKEIEENAVVAKELQDGIEEQNSGKADMQQEKIENNLDYLEDLDFKSRSSYNTEVQLALGKKYGDGVHRQNYQKTNSYGEVYEFITRIIVVKKGFGNDYYRVKNKLGVTYFKNGAPITEYQFNAETQG